MTDSKSSTENQALAQAVLAQSRGGELPCAVAFQIAADLHLRPEAVGRAADENRVRLVKCQLGLFGYQPAKKIVKPLDPVPEELSAMIRDGLTDGRLPCRHAWEIAARLKLPKMTVSAACESLGIKIKPCQLGAF